MWWYSHLNYTYTTIWIFLYHRKGISCLHYLKMLNIVQRYTQPSSSCQNKGNTLEIYYYLGQTGIFKHQSQENNILYRFFNNFSLQQHTFILIKHLLQTTPLKNPKRIFNTLWKTSSCWLKQSINEWPRANKIWWKTKTFLLRYLHQDRIIRWWIEQQIFHTK